MLAFLHVGAASDLQNYKCVNWHVCKYTYVTSKKSKFSEHVHVLGKRKKEKISYECLGAVFVVLFSASRKWRLYGCPPLK